MSEKGRVDIGFSGDANDVLRQLDRIIGKQSKMLEGFTRAHQRTAGFSGALEAGLGAGVRQLASLAIGFGGLAGQMRIARGIFQQFQADIARGAENIRSFQEDFINLQFLGEHLKDPKYRGRVLAEARRTGIGEKEVAGGLYTFESMTAYAAGDPNRRAGMWNEMVKLRKAGSVPLAELAPTFTKMGGIYQNLNGREMANITHYLLEQAAIEDPASLAKQAPRFFAAGKVGGVDARTAAALGAVLTSKTGTDAQAAQGLDIILRKVMLKDPDEQEALRSLAFGAADPLAGRKNLMGQAGVGATDDAWQRLQKLSTLKLSTSDLKDLFSERGLRYGKILLDDIAGAREMVGKFQAKTGPDVDMVGGKLGLAETGDVGYRMTQAGDRLGVRVSTASQRADRLVWDNLARAVDAIGEERGWDPGRRFFEKGRGGVLQMMGIVPGSMMGDPMVTASASLAGTLKAEGMAKTDREAVLRARQMLGIDPGEQARQLEQATEGLFRAAESLQNASRRTADANAHVETPAGK